MTSACATNRPAPILGTAEPSAATNENPNRFEVLDDGVLPSERLFPWEDRRPVPVAILF
jgi:hypothetical protein